VNGKPWSEEEVQYLTKVYCHLPVAVIRERLEKRFGVRRSADAIETKAGRLFISDRVPPGYVRLAWAHPHGANTSRTILKAALRAGVARRQGGGRGNPWLAPERWVDEWLAAHKRQPALVDADVIKRTWMRTQEVAKLVGIRKSHAAADLLHNRTRVAKVFRKVRRYRFMDEAGQPWYWHPEDVREAVEAVAELKNKPAGDLGWRWVSENL
jgi:hypothetical protein